MAEIATHSWFYGPDRVSIYPDNTVEIQSGDRAYRATFARWVEAAEMVNVFATANSRTEIGGG